MVSYVIIQINPPSPVDSGVSYTLYTRTTTTGTTLDFNKHCKIEFVAYADNHESLIAKNSIQYRTKTCIYLGPTGNIQGSHWFLNFRTGLRIKHRTFTPLTAPTPSFPGSMRQLTRKIKNQLLTSVIVMSTQLRAPTLPLPPSLHTTLMTQE